MLIDGRVAVEWVLSGRVGEWHRGTSAASVVRWGAQQREAETGLGNDVSVQGARVLRGATAACSLSLKKISQTWTPLGQTPIPLKRILNCMQGLPRLLDSVLLLSFPSA